MSAGWIAFVGPTLSQDEARKFGCEVRAPARQGDVWRALAGKPRALVLIDGVFESQPSVWHHELRAALASGVAVFGASSMGALRAAELWHEGMIGVGEIFRSYRDGKRIDDADVALLHASEEHGFKALTLPLVNAEHAVILAGAQKVLGPVATLRLKAGAGRVHYQHRSWPAVLDAAKLKPAERLRFEQWLARTDIDLKASDARAALSAAAEWVASGAPAPVARACAASSHVRRRRLVDAVPGALEKVQGAADAEALADAGTRRLLLAGWARAMGVVPEPAEVARWQQTLPHEGIAPDEAVRLAEDLALEQVMIRFPDP